MAGKQGGAVVLLATLVLAAVFGVSTAATVTVGGKTGWTLPTSSPSFYTTWASQQKLHVGDTLVFTFPAGMHTVAEVSKANYDACTTTSTVGPVMKTAPASITLTSPGTHYFICTIPGHCTANQKVAVTVAASSATKMAPTTSPMSAPTAAPPMTTAMPPMAAGSAPATSPSEASGPSGSGAASAPPPAGSSAASAGVGLLSLLSIVAAFLVC